MRRSSTRISSVCGSALLPSLRTVWPFTETRPSTISFSAARRDATPAVERIFCSRTSITEFSPRRTRRAQRNLRSNCSVFSVSSVVQLLFQMRPDESRPDLVPRRRHVFAVGHEEFRLRLSIGAHHVRMHVDVDTILVPLAIGPNQRVG